MKSVKVTLAGKTRRVWKKQPRQLSRRPSCCPKVGRSSTGLPPSKRLPGCGVPLEGDGPEHPRADWAYLRPERSWRKRKCLKPTRRHWRSLHKDSKWDQQLKAFRDSNMALDRFFEMKMKCAKSNNALGWVSHSADSQGQGLADSQGHSKMMDAEACANHHLPGPVGDGDQEPQRRVGWERPGQGTANVVHVGALPRPGWAETLCLLVAPGHLSLQHRAAPMSRVATAEASRTDPHSGHAGYWCPSAATRSLGTGPSALSLPYQAGCNPSWMGRGGDGLHCCPAPGRLVAAGPQAHKPGRAQRLPAPRLPPRAEPRGLGPLATSARLF